MPKPNTPSRTWSSALVPPHSHRCRLFPKSPSIEINHGPESPVTANSASRHATTTRRYSFATTPTIMHLTPSRASSTTRSLIPFPIAPVCSNKQSPIVASSLVPPVLSIDSRHIYSSTRPLQLPRIPRPSSGSFACRPHPSPSSSDAVSKPMQSSRHTIQHLLFTNSPKSHLSRSLPPYMSPTTVGRPLPDPRALSF